LADLSRLHVRLTPKSSVDRIDGWDQDDKGRKFLKVRVRAAPIEGRANEALIVFLAKNLKVPKSRVSLVAGDTARVKTVEVEGLSEDEIAVMFGAGASDADKSQSKQETPPPTRKRRVGPPPQIHEE